MHKLAERPHRGRVVVAVGSTILAPSFRAEQEATPAPRSGPTIHWRTALVLVAASYFFLIFAAALGAAWSLGVAIVCAVIAAPLAESAA